MLRRYIYLIINEIIFLIGVWNEVTSSKYHLNIGPCQDSDLNFPVNNDQIEGGENTKKEEKLKPSR